MVDTDMHCLGNVVQHYTVAGIHTGDIAYTCSFYCSPSVAGPLYSPQFEYLFVVGMVVVHIYNSPHKLGGLTETNMPIHRHFCIQKIDVISVYLVSSQQRKDIC